MSETNNENQPPEQNNSASTSSSSIGSRIFRATLVVSLANILAKILGLARIQAVAYQYGAGDITDAYWTVFNGVIMALFLLGEECIQPAFLPIFMEARKKDGEKAAWRFASTLINAQFIVLLTTVCFLMIFPGRIISLITDWENHPEDAAKLTEATSFLRIMAPALIGFSLGSVTFILLNAGKKFFLASLGEGTWRAVFIACVVVLGTERFLGNWALPLGITLGSVAKVATHIPGLFKQLRNYRPVLHLNSPRFRRFLLLIAPLVAGSLFAKVRDNYNQIYVMSTVENGLLSVNLMGRMFTDTLGFLVPYALSVGMFPFLCEMVDRGEHKNMGPLLAGSSRLMVYFFLPMAFVMAVISVPLSRLLFEMGKLNTDDARLVGMMTACYALALPAYGVERVMMKGFFSNRNTVPPFIAGVFWSLVSMVSCWYLVVYRQWHGVYALKVVAISYVATRILKTLTLVVLLKRKIPMLPWKEWVPFMLKIGVITGTCASLSWTSHLLMQTALPAQSKIVLATHLAVIGLTATLTFLITSWALNIKELKTVVDTVKPRAMAILKRLGSRRGQ